DPVQIGGKPLVNLRVIEPLPGLCVDLRCAGLKEEHVPTVLEGRDVLVEGFPVVGDDHDPAFARELPLDALTLQAPRDRVPGHDLFLSVWHWHLSKRTPLLSAQRASTSSMTTNRSRCLFLLYRVTVEKQTD